MDPLKTSPVPEARLHFLDYWRIIRIRKAVIISVFLLVSITATFVTWFLPKSYASHARIKIQHDAPDRPGIEGNAVSGMSYDPFFIQTEFEVIQSERVLDRVVTNVTIQGKSLADYWTDKFHRTAKMQVADCRRVLKGLIDLRPVRNTSLIDITVYSDDKDDAAILANEVAEQYKNYRLEQQTALLTNAMGAFARQLDKLEGDIKVAESNVNYLRVKLEVTDLNPQQMEQASTLEPMTVAQINGLKITALNDAAKEEKQLNVLKALPPERLRDTLTRIVPDQVLSSLLQDLQTAETTLVSLRATLGPENPEVKQKERIIEDLNKKIDSQVEGMMTAMQTRLDTLKAAAKSSQDQLNEARSNDMKVARDTLPYWAAKTELDRLRRLRDVLYLRTSQEEVEKQMPKTQMVELIETAAVNDRPVKPNKPVNIALGVIIGLVVGLGLAFFIEYLDTSVKTIDDVERTLQAPVLGVIPQNVGYLMEEGPESPHAEAYRVLRTNLLFTRKDDKLNTIAVVSAGAGEGKSTTVCNLAAVFAQSGQRVLMVDSDLRRPTLHKLMQVSNSLGLTNYLMKQNSLEEVIQTTKLPTLDFMASGKLPSSSLGILNSAQMKDLIGELKHRYDFVLFDSPPIMGVSDASVLASEVDMTVQVIQYRRYPQPMNIRAKQLIEKVGGNLVGIVLNNINMAQDESYYYYSGYYHDYYSKEDDDVPGSNGGAPDKSRLGKPKV